MLPGFPPAQPKVQVQPVAPAAKAAQTFEPSKKTSEPQAIAVVDNYLKVIGGKEVLAKIKDKTTKYTNVKFEATGEVKVEINLLMKDAICIREEWDVKGFKIKDMPLAFVQIYNGRQEEGWVHMMDTVSPLEGKTLQLFVRDKYMDDFFCHWQSDGYILSLAGQGLVGKEFTGTDEQACDILLVSDFWGREVMHCYFSKSTGLLLKKEWEDVGTTAKSTMAKKEKFYKDYRDIPFMDGSGLSIKFALRNENYVDGDMDTEQIYTEVRINSGLSDKLFDRPPGKAFDRAALEGQKAAKDAEKKVEAEAGEDAKAAHGREKPPIIQIPPTPEKPAEEKPKESAPTPIVPSTPPR
jgi:hypothetical protein